MKNDNDDMIKNIMIYPKNKGLSPHSRCKLNHPLCAAVPCESSSQSVESRSQTPRNLALPLLSSLALPAPTGRGPAPSSS